MKTDRGFSIVELLVAMGVMTVCMGAMLTLVTTGQAIARTQPEAADQQQRARTARQAIGDALARAGAGLDSGPMAGPLDTHFPPLLRSADGGLTTWSVTTASAQATLAYAFGSTAASADVQPAAACPAAEAACAFTAGTNAIVFDATGCHEVIRIDDVAASALMVRPAVRLCAFGAGASIAEGEARTFLVDPAARQLLRRDEATRTTLPIVDNVSSMEVDVLDSGRRVTVTLRFASFLIQVPELVLIVAGSPANLREAR